jgi:hypothetical protein
LDALEEGAQPPRVRATSQATSPRMWRTSVAPAVEMWPWRAGSLPDWRTLGSRPREPTSLRGEEKRLRAASRRSAG